MDIVLWFIAGAVVGGAVSVLFIRQRSKAENEISGQREQKEENKRKIIELITRTERISNDEVEQLLNVSDATAERYLDELEKEGVLVQKGRTGRGVYYELNGSTG